MGVLKMPIKKQNCKEKGSTKDMRKEKLNKAVAKLDESPKLKKILNDIITQMV